MREKLRRQANSSLLAFTIYTKRDYIVNWHHKLVCDKLDQFARGEIKNLMIFMPPQHGKSELATRRLPAYLLGRNPNLRIALGAYNDTFASKFNRQIQRIIESPQYQDVFPTTKLNSNKGGYVKTQSEFEIVGHDGSFISVGVKGGVTGNPVDIFLFDDPIKGAEEANSTTYRNNLFEWYVSEAQTRLHNKSQKLLTITRWHDDDLAGRILKDMEEGGEHWEVISLPYVNETGQSVVDPRNIGEALWPEMHSLEKGLNIKRLSAKVWTALYQQNPAPPEGNIINTSWFSRFSLNVIERDADLNAKDLIWNFTVDGAFTEKESNDPSAIMAWAYLNNNLYIRDIGVVRNELPDLIRFIKDFVYRNGYSDESKIYIEPKASGMPAAQTLKKETALNVILDKAPTTDKVSRVESCAPFMESGRVYLLESASWIDLFLNECRLFPNGKHDDQVDTLTMAINKSKRDETTGYFGFSSI